jgi:hypothetical protein
MRYVAMYAAAVLAAGLLVGVGASPATAAASPRISLPGSVTYPGTRVYTGSLLPTSSATIRPRVVLGHRMTFVRGKLVAAKRVGSSWRPVEKVVATKRAKVQLSLRAGTFRLTYVARTAVKGRVSTTRTVSYLTVVRGSAPRPPIVVPPPPAPVPPSLV